MPRKDAQQRMKTIERLGASKQTKPHDKTLNEPNVVITMGQVLQSFKESAIGDLTDGKNCIGHGSIPSSICTAGGSAILKVIGHTINAAAG
jgi:hypothetical protein